MAERTLILFRHAKSDWSGSGPDIDRPLGKRGRREARDAGRWLAAGMDRIDLAVVSPALRARSTWDIASAELDEAPQLRTEDRVYAASDTALLDLVRELPDELHSVVLVGHNPGIEDMAGLLSGERVPMPTSTLAVLELSGAWASAAPSSATLRTSGRPPAD